MCIFEIYLVLQNRRESYLNNAYNHNVLLLLLYSKITFITDVKNIFSNEIVTFTATNYLSILRICYKSFFSISIFIKKTVQKHLCILLKYPNYFSKGFNIVFSNVR